MSLISGYMQPEEVDGTTTSLGATTASATQTAHPNAYVLINVSAAMTITFGSSTGRAPTVPSASVGYLLNATYPYIFWLGPNRDSFKIFNTTAGAANFSWQLMYP